MQRVTPWNVHQMRDAVENGPLIHPGATHVEDEEGRIISLATLAKFKRTALAKTLLSTPGTAVRGVSVEGGRSIGKTVYRHLRDGDVLLVNRQVSSFGPTCEHVFGTHLVLSPIVSLYICLFIYLVYLVISIQWFSSIVGLLMSSRCIKIITTPIC